MKKPIFRRGVSFTLALAMAASFGMTAFAAEEDGLCEHHPSHTANCGYEATGLCSHTCTDENGCISVKCSHEHDTACYNTEGRLNCSHACTSTPACYTPVTRCLHKEHGSCGHHEGEDCAYAKNGCADCENPVIELKGTDIVLNEGTEYIYTGQEIRPAVTVTVDRTVLIENEHYTVAYANNIGVGTATVSVTGVPEAGFEGTVILPFTISKEAGTAEFQLVEIKGTDVVMEEGPFSYTGQPIEPKVTVTVDGKILTEGQDYTVTYINNLAPGTGTLTVRGIATASETLGYFGKVSMDFTIGKAEDPTEPEIPAEPEAPTEPEKPTEPETPTEPEKPADPETPTQPESPTEPEVPSTPDKEEEETQPEETKPFEYQITKGSGSKWHQESGKDLQFTVNADTKDITSLRIDGKKLDPAYYTLGKDGTVTLKNSWLKKQAIGTYRINVDFDGGSAQGKFTVAAAQDTSNPQTGDSIGLWFGLMAVSLAGIGLVLLGRKKFLK